ncbi:hypothetical protein FACS1894163_07070 [Spirochaetia bacterium]|nr:hypothetical protein FACS1894163_07070 [Spirochaetia bacterium]
MELLNFKTNPDSFSIHEHIESVLLWGNPDAISDDTLISICIPTYKRPDLLKEALLSALGQDTDTPYKIIIGDNDPDFNNQEVLDVVQSLNNNNILYYKHKENLGAGGNWNRFFILANTPWVALLHDDDLLLSDYISTITGIIERHGNKFDALANNFGFLWTTNILDRFKQKFAKKRGSSFVIFLYDFSKKCYDAFCNIIFFYIKQKQLVRITLADTIFLENVHRSPTCGMIFRRESMISSGGFNISSGYSSGDWYFCIYFTEHWRFFKLKKRLGIYRFGNMNDTFTVLDKLAQEKKLCIQSLKAHNWVCRFLINWLEKYPEGKNHSVLLQIIKKYYFFKHYG